jgi:N-acetylmuramoyl-L-alanine amidase
LLKNKIGGRIMKVALIVGHTSKSPGACNKKHGVCEYPFNDKLSIEIYDSMKINYPHIHLVIIRRRSYKTLPQDVNAVNPKFAISMHCNAINGNINFTETLYYHTSDRGKKLAEIVQKEMVQALGFRDRGIKPKTVEDRGGHILRYTNMPVVIAEPFFIDNDSAFEHVIKNKYDMLKNAYIQSLVKGLDKLG